MMSNGMTKIGMFFRVVLIFVPWIIMLLFVKYYPGIEYLKSFDLFYGVICVLWFSVLVFWMPFVWLFGTKRDK